MTASDGRLGSLGDRKHLLRQITVFQQMGCIAIHFWVSPKSLSLSKGPGARQERG